MKEATMVNRALTLLNDRKSGARAWRNNTGRAVYLHRVVDYGIPGRNAGGSDIIGIDATGRFVACEVKVGRRQPTKQQMRFLMYIKRQGGIAYLYNEEGLQEL